MLWGRGADGADRRSLTHVHIEGSSSSKRVARHATAAVTACVCRSNTTGAWRCNNQSCYAKSSSSNSSSTGGKGDCTPLVMVRKRSCPAVSQICSLTHLLSRKILRILKSILHTKGGSTRSYGVAAWLVAGYAAHSRAHGHSSESSSCACCAKGTRSSCSAPYSCNKAGSERVVRKTQE
jgi:hypothetical protein